MFLIDLSSRLIKGCKPIIDVAGRLDIYISYSSKGLIQFLGKGVNPFPIFLEDLTFTIIKGYINPFSMFLVDLTSTIIKGYKPILGVSSGLDIHIYQTGTWKVSSRTYKFCKGFGPSPLIISKHFACFSPERDVDSSTALNSR